jgi:pyruvate/2-oxoacid:ferredoxin oxidoreductase alpha subunit
MNNWMADGFTYPDKPINRGKLLTEEALAKLGEWGRYKDVDGDGIPYRTIPGDGMPVYFARGSGHNAKGQYSERPDDYVDNMDRLARKFETARRFVPKPEIDQVTGAKIGFIGYGTSHWAIGESRDSCARRPTSRRSYFRLRAYPFTEELEAFIDAHDRIYVIEPEPRCAAAAADEARGLARAAAEAAQRAPLQRPAHRRPQHHRRRPRAGRVRGGEEDVKNQRWNSRRRVVARISDFRFQNSDVIVDCLDF